ncbi:MAG: hypothetical protein A2X97_01810 [Bdellovibrionales bacterium GWA1_52_35]|nr:MAG: hypothetical protein A2X97_01810 [Bdellovibrionales bacterium GWA1_52_35]
MLSGICLCSSVHALTTPHSKIISASSNNKTVRVRLTETIARAEVRGFDLSLLAGPTRKYSTSKDKMSRWEFRCSNGKVRALQLLEKGASAAIELPEPVTIHTPAGFLSFGGKPYRNELRIYSKGSTCEVINEVDLEKYLDGLVNSEFSARWNEDAIAAQVVAARTYAYYQMLQARAANRHYDVDATIKDQVYDGSIREDFRSSRAVEKSHGIVLTLGTANAPVPLKAFYHSTCGGHTELPQNVWGNPHPGFKRAVRCEFCNRSPVYSWDVPMNGKEIGQALKAGALKGGAFPGWPKNWKQTLQKGQLLDLRIAHITPQGRVLRLRTLWADGPNAVELTISGSRFREWIGSTRIKSALFQVSAERAGKRLAGVAPPGNKREWHFRGRGNGHGVGMCQWGAKVMGEKGYTMGAILKLYYPDAILRRLW